MVAALPVARLALQLLRGGWEVRIDLRKRMVTRRHRSLRPKWNDSFSLDDFNAVELRNIPLDSGPVAVGTAWLVGPGAEINLFEPPEVTSDVTHLLNFQRIVLTDWPLRQGEEIARRCGLPFRNVVEPVTVHAEDLGTLYPGEIAEPIPCPEIGDVLTIRRQPAQIRRFGLAIAVLGLAVVALATVIVASDFSGPAKPIPPQLPLGLFLIGVPLAFVGLITFFYRSEIIIDRARRTLTERRQLFRNIWEPTRPLDDFAEVYLSTMNLPFLVSPFRRTFVTADLIGPGAKIIAFSPETIPTELLGESRRLASDARIRLAAGALASFCSMPYRIGSPKSEPAQTDDPAETVPA
jgi:hypothetical protein